LVRRVVFNRQDRGAGAAPRHDEPAIHFDVNIRIAAEETATDPVSHNRITVAALDGDR
jgi:hypothetical protein